MPLKNHGPCPGGDWVRRMFELRKFMPAATSEWPGLARSLYCELLDFMMSIEGPIPDDPAFLRGVIGATRAYMREHWPLVRSILHRDSSGGLYNPDVRRAIILAGREWNGDLPAEDGGAEEGGSR